MYIRVILLSQTTNFHLPFSSPPYFPHFTTSFALSSPFPCIGLNYVDRLNTLALGNTLYTFFVSLPRFSSGTPSGSQLSWISANKGDCRHFGLPVHAELTSPPFSEISTCLPSPTTSPIRVPLPRPRPPILAHSNHLESRTIRPPSEILSCGPTGPTATTRITTLIRMTDTF